MWEKRDLEITSEHHELNDEHHALVDVHSTNERVKSQFLYSCKICYHAHPFQGQGYRPITFIEMRHIVAYL